MFSPQEKIGTKKPKKKKSLPTAVGRQSAKDLPTVCSR